MGHSGFQRQEQRDMTSKSLDVKSNATPYFHKGRESPTIWTCFNGKIVHGQMSVRIASDWYIQAGPQVEL